MIGMDGVEVAQTETGILGETEGLTGTALLTVGLTGSEEVTAGMTEASVAVREASTETEVGSEGLIEVVTPGGEVENEEGTTGETTGGHEKIEQEEQEEVSTLLIIFIFQTMLQCKATKALVAGVVYTPLNVWASIQSVSRGYITRHSIGCIHECLLSCRLHSIGCVHECLFAVV